MILHENEDVPPIEKEMGTRYCIHCIDNSNPPSEREDYGRIWNGTVGNSDRLRFSTCKAMNTDTDGG